MTTFHNVCTPVLQSVPLFMLSHSAVDETAVELGPLVNWPPYEGYSCTVPI